LWQLNRGQGGGGEERPPAYFENGGSETSYSIALKTKKAKKWGVESWEDDGQGGGAHLMCSKHGEKEEKPDLSETGGDREKGGQGGTAVRRIGRHFWKRAKMSEGPQARLSGDQRRFRTKSRKGN